MHALEAPLDAQQAVDMLAIQQCLGRAVLGNDLLDVAMWKSAYWPDAIEDHGWFVGNAHDFIDETVGMLERDMETTWHALGVPVIAIDGDEARSIVYFTSYVRMKAAAGTTPDDLVSGGRYVDHLAKRDGRWCIVHRTSKGDWIRLDAASYTWGQPVLGGFVPQMGLRAFDDPARVLLGQMAPPRP